MRLKIQLAYDGTQFHGWAKQPDLRTVQGVIEGSIAKVLRIHEDDGCPRLVVAGRTDTGVHARHQVCHLDLAQEVLARAVGNLSGVDLPGALEHRLRHVLPPDISIYSVEEAPEGFDARFSALERTYVFRICDDWHHLDPRTRNYVLPVKSQLNESALQRTAQMISGLKDFGSFAIPNPGGTTIRDVKCAQWERRSADPGSFGAVEPGAGTLEFTIVADAFARNMVRSLVGAQVQVGLGKKSVEWFAQKLATPLREGSTGPIAPQGLTLEHVAYPDDSELGARAQAIRAKRTLQ